MTENRSPAVLVAGVHRRIRMLDQQEGPFAGELVADGDDVRVRMDAGDCAEAPFWVFTGADHVAGPLDLVRRADGLDVLLPWCTERVGAFLGRRAAAEEPLATGESVTLAGSLLRGLVELDGSELPGVWWLTDGGRPVFVLGEGESAAEGARTLVSRLRAGVPDRSLERLLAEIESGLADPRAARRRMDRWEADLTELAAPRPLQREVFAPAAAGEVAAKRFPVAVDIGVDDRRGWRVLVAERFAGTTEGLRDLARRARSRGRHDRQGREHPEPERDTPKRRPAGRRPLLIAAAAAALVLAAGLLWPTGDGDEPASAQAVQKPAQKRPTPGSAAPTATPESPQTDDPVAVVPVLLKQIGQCLRKRDERCADAIVDGSGPAVLAALQDSDAADSAALVDSYGDIAVIRRGEPEKEQQILVLLRQKDEWLVRDVYAVADQPGSS